MVHYMDDYENECKYNLAETCCASVSLNDLKGFANAPDSEVVDFSQKQVYGAIRGSDALRKSIARTHSDATAAPIESSQLLVTNGAIQANYLALYTLIAPGDHVICQYPTYQQLYTIPESFGAEVDLWRSKPDEQWKLDLEELRSLIKPNTKLIIINNPQNPTGAVQSLQTLQSLVDIAREHDITIHSDEVYRPLFHSVQEVPPSIVSLGYEKCYATGSMSKAYSLAGIRLGWITSPSQSIIEALQLVGITPPSPSARLTIKLRGSRSTQLSKA
ncbi:putative aminotransferase [Aureobasidium pullulans]|uniref:Putative aminotransferase n=1 Tax=Aureobasidium pullulans TaxID=5580 RepID=A0A4S9ARI1_AURPU|nr:putative aminotransferase [Aureobasidium pullulans]